jgi:hypothetical protein
LPQEATLQVAGLTRFETKAFSVYLEDNWQRNSRMTPWGALGSAVPYVEASGRMANLDVRPGFTAATVVTPGAAGPLSSVVFPASLIRTDWNNVGPRVGMAYRLAPGTASIRATASRTTRRRHSIAQRLVAQPPFAETETNAGSLEDPSARDRFAWRQRHHHYQ